MICIIQGLWPPNESINQRNLKKTKHALAVTKNLGLKVILAVQQRQFPHCIIVCRFRNGKWISSEALIFNCFYFTEANILLESLYWSCILPDSNQKNHFQTKFYKTSRLRPGLLFSTFKIALSHIHYAAVCNFCKAILCPALPSDFNLGCWVPCEHC